MNRALLFPLILLLAAPSSAVQVQGPEAPKLARALGAEKASSKALLPVLTQLRGLDLAQKRSLLADPGVSTALAERVFTLGMTADSPSSSLAQVQDAHYQLMLIERELGEAASELLRGQIAHERAAAAKSLDAKVSGAIESVAKVLEGTRAPLEDGAVSDASREAKTGVAAVLRPATEAEVVAALEEARRRGVSLSVSGARHSQGGQIASPGSVHINMDGFKAMSFDPKRNLVTVQSGALWGDIQKLLDAHGKSLDVTQVPNYFSVGGTLGVNAHGHNVDSGPAASAVESVRLLKADGSIVRASRTENADLFRLVMGGYGLFGVVLDAEIRVRDNALYTPSFHLVDYKDFARFHAEDLLGDPATKYTHNMISVAPGSFLKEIQVVRYRQLEGDLLPLVRRTWFNAVEASVSKFLYSLNVRGGFARTFSWKLLTRFLYVFADKRQTRNRVMNEPFTHFSTGKDNEAQILQEYFVPRARFAEFMDKARAIYTAEPSRLQLVSVRAVKADPDAFMNYAPQDVFGVVFISNHRDSAVDYARLTSVTRKLVDAALEVGGRFYLPYRLVYSHDQLARSYPQLQEFLAKKLEHDPERRFSNALYEKYSAAAPVVAPDLGRDRSDEYASAGLTRENVETLKTGEVVFVDGLGADALGKMGGYFTDQRKWLTSMGVPNRKAPTNPQAGPAANAAAIAAMLEKAEKPVWFVTHSKGGIDLLEALLARPDLQPKVKGWLAIQAPFKGSPLADWHHRNPNLRRPVLALLKLLGGDASALKELETPWRSQHIEKNAEAIRQLAARVPILSAATWKEKGESRFDSILTRERDWMEKQGIKSDGMVPRDSAVLPYADRAFIEGVDHQMSVTPSVFAKFDRAEFTGKLMSMLLSKPGEIAPSVEPARAKSEPTMPSPQRARLIAVGAAVAAALVGSASYLLTDLSSSRPYAYVMGMFFLSLQAAEIAFAVGVMIGAFKGLAISKTRMLTRGLLTGLAAAALTFVGVEVLLSLGVLFTRLGQL